MRRSLFGKIAFLTLLVAVSQAVFLATIGVYSIRAVASANEQLSDISSALSQVRTVNMRVASLSRPLWDDLADPRGRPEHASEFRASVDSVRRLLRGCGTSVCHGTKKTPAEMVQTVIGEVDAIAETGVAVLDRGEGSNGEDAAVGYRQVTESVDRVSDRIDHMSAALSERVGTLTRTTVDVKGHAVGLFLVATVFSLWGAVVAAVLLARHIARPISGLMDATDRVARGDLGVRIQDTTGDEVGTLVRSFNRMAADLADVRAELERTNQGLADEVRRVVEDVRARDEALRRAERLASLGLLAGSAAHELKNPLTSVVLKAALLREKAPPGSQMAASLAQIEADAARCQRFVDDLRGVLRQGGSDIRPVAVGEVVRGAVRLIAHAMDLKGVACEVRGLDPGPLVECDPERLQQVFVNLLSNSLQAVGRGGRIVVEVQALDNAALVAVKDDGPGIQPGDRSRLFEKFFTTRRDGLGLGLAISQEIALEHRGTIRSESRVAGEGGSPEHWTRMVVTLPIASDARGDEGRRCSTMRGA